MTIDDRLRRFRSYLPDTGTGEAASREVARRVMERAKAAPAPHASRTRRRGVAVAAVTGLAAMGALTVVAVKTDRQANTASTIVIGKPRVDWGMRALVSVTPDPGVSVEDATQRAKELIAERLERMDVQGAEVGSPKPGQVSLKVPGAESPSQFDFVSQIPHIQVYRASQVVAEGQNLDELRREIGSRVAGPRPKYLVEQRARSNLIPMGITEYDTMAEIRQTVRRKNPKRYSVKAINRSWTFAQQSATSFRYLVIAGDPVVPSTDLEVTVEDENLKVKLPQGIRFDGDPLVIVNTMGRPASRSRLPAEASQPVVVVNGSLKGGRAQTALWTMGRAGSIPDAAIPRTTLISRNDFVSFTRYGRRPSLSGVTLASPPRWTGATGSATRVLSKSAGRVNVFYYVWRLGPTTPVLSYALTIRGAVPLVMQIRSPLPTSPCPVGVGAPPINPCLNHPLGSAGGGGNATLPGVLLAGGRVGRDVERIEAQLQSGRVLTAQIDGTWFAVATDTQVARDDKTSDLTLTAYAKDGRVLQRTDVGPRDRFNP